MYLEVREHYALLAVPAAHHIQSVLNLGSSLVKWRVQN